MPCTMEITAIRNITPIVTPSSVKKLFSFWTRICARASQTASMNGTLDLERSGDFDLGQELLAAVVARDEPVAQHDDTARVRRDIGFVRHHDHRLAFGGE